MSDDEKLELRALRRYYEAAERAHSEDLSCYDEWPTCALEHEAIAHFKAARREMELLRGE